MYHLAVAKWVLSWRVVRSLLNLLMILDTLEAGLLADASIKKPVTHVEDKAI